MDRHQLDRRDAERAQVRDDGFRGDGRIGAAQLFRNLRMQHRHAANMRFVNDGLVQRRGWPLLAAPVEARVDHRTDGRKRCAVPVIERKIAVRVAQTIAEQFIRPFQLASDGLGIRIEQQLVRIEAQPRVRIVGAMHAIAVQLTRTYARKVDVPGAVRPFADPDPRPRSCPTNRTGRARPIPSFPRRAKNSRRARPRWPLSGRASRRIDAIGRPEIGVSLGRLEGILGMCGHRRCAGCAPRSLFLPWVGSSQGNGRARVRRPKRINAARRHTAWLSAGLQRVCRTTA